MSNIINTAAECNIKQFMSCAFYGKHRVLLIDGEATDDELREAFEYIYNQYVDYSGLFATREFELAAYIHSLKMRIGIVREFVKLQKMFIAEFNIPFVAYFEIIKKYGHNLHWNHEYPDIDLFLIKLAKVESREAKYKSELKAKEKELFDLQRKKITKEFTLLGSRKQFLLTLARLQQAKFVISKTETMMDEVALMIKDQKDQSEEANAQRSFKKIK